MHTYYPLELFYQTQLLYCHVCIFGCFLVTNIVKHLPITCLHLLGHCLHPRCLFGSCIATCRCMLGSYTSTPETCWALASTPDAWLDFASTQMPVGTLPPPRCLLGHCLHFICLLVSCLNFRYLLCSCLHLRCSHLLKQDPWWAITFSSDTDAKSSHDNTLGHWLLLGCPMQCTSSDKYLVGSLPPSQLHICADADICWSCNVHIRAISFYFLKIFKTCYFFTWVGTYYFTISSCQISLEVRIMITAHPICVGTLCSNLSG